MKWLICVTSGLDDYSIRGGGGGVTSGQWFSSPWKRFDTPVEADVIVLPAPHDFPADFWLTCSNPSGVWNRKGYFRLVSLPVLPCQQRLLASGNQLPIQYWASLGVYRDLWIKIQKWKRHLIQGQPHPTTSIVRLTLRVSLLIHFNCGLLLHALWGWNIFTLLRSLKMSLV